MESAALPLVQVEYYRVTSEVAIRNAGLQMTAMVEGGNSQRAFGSSFAQLGISFAQVYGQLAGAAVSGMNTLAANILTE